MSTFWLIYLVALGINLFITALVAGLFDIEEYNEKKEISWSYVLLADFIAAIPGLGMLLTTFIVFGVVGGAYCGTLVPKENPFGN